MPASRWLLLFSFAFLGCRRGEDTHASAAAPTEASSQASVAAPAAAVAAAEPAIELKPGDPAPAVTLTLADGKQVPLSSLKGKYVVVYFYPKDETSGCTVEAEGLRDSWKTLQAFDTEIFGVSVQDAASHQAFADKHQLPFPLVVDTNHEVLKSFGVPLRGDLASRQTFLIGPDGVIAKIWRQVDPAKHAQEIVDAVANH